MPQLQKLGIESITHTNVLPFALGLTRHDFAAYMDPTILTDALERAHRLLFAIAMQELLVEKPDFIAARPGIVTEELEAIKVSPWKSF